MKLNAGLRVLTPWLCRVDSIERIKDKFAQFDAELADSSTFSQIFRYAFEFLKPEDSRVLDIQLASGMLGLLLKDRFELIPKFLEFLKVCCF